MGTKAGVGRVMSACAAVLAALTACGGGNEQLDSVALRAEQIETKHFAQGAGPTIKARAAVPGVDPVDAANLLFAFAESNLANYFPSSQPTRKLNGWTYRYYPQTGIYLAVIDWRVYVMGGSFGPEVIDAGELTKYVTPAQPIPPALTATKLAACPDASATISGDFYSCMVGSLSGTQVFDTTKTCTFNVSAEGQISLESNGLRYAVAKSDFDSPIYAKSSSSGFFQINVNSSSAKPPVTMLKIEAVTGGSTNLFKQGGELRVTGSLFLTNQSLNCKFIVPL